MSEAKKQMSKNTKIAFLAFRPDHFDIQIYSCGYANVTNWNYSNVIFNMWLLYWNPTFGGEVTVNGTVIPLIPERVFLIPPYTAFSTRNNGPFQHFYLHFSAPSPFDRVKRDVLSLPSDHIRALLPRFLDGRNTESMPLLFRLLIYEYLYRIPKDSFLAPGETMDQRIRKAIGIMSRESAKPHDNQEIAKRVGMSLNNFYRLFLAETGTTPKQYLLNLKMEEARQILIHTDTSIDDAASITGFADRYHFSKVFKSFFSLPPAAYRDSFRQTKRETEPEAAPPP